MEQGLGVTEQMTEVDVASPRDIDVVVARNLKRVRTARGVSLSTLARTSGVARATLYQMEAAQGNPTIDTLFAVSTALRVALSELVTDSEPPAVQIIRAKDGPQVAGSALSARLIRRFDAGARVLELYDLRIFPGGQTDAHAHPAGVIEHVLVSQGTLATGPPEHLAELGPGDYISFRADVPHHYRALSDDPVIATLLMDYPPAMNFSAGDALRL
jgi:transcriptional regulator with XRE-family HTH domain